MTKNSENLWAISSVGDHLIILKCKACGEEFPPSCKRDPDRRVILKSFKCGACQKASKQAYDKAWAADNKTHRALYMRRYRRRRKTTSPRNSIFPVYSSTISLP